MLFKFGHTGDVHIGALKRWAPENNEYLARQEHNLKDLLKKTAEEKLDFFVISGDFFDHANIGVDDLFTGATFLKELSSLVKFVILTPGNHDEGVKGKFVTDFLKFFTIPNLIIVNKTEFLTKEVNGHSVNILASPWTGIKDVEEMKKFLTKDLLYGQNIDIAMLHECFMGSVLDNGRKMSGVEVPDLGAQYYACGDIHKFQKLNLPNAYFSGSPMQVKTDDATDKGFIVVEAHTPFEYKPRFVKLENQIELRQISKLEEITETHHWYKLVCPVNQKPLEIPPCVRVFAPLPAVEDGEVFVKRENLLEGVEQVEEREAEESLKVDYLFGVENLLVEGQYTKEEIELTKNEISAFLLSKGT